MTPSRYSAQRSFFFLFILPFSWLWRAESSDGTDYGPQILHIATHPGTLLVSRSDVDGDPPESSEALKWTYLAIDVCFNERVVVELADTRAGPVTENTDALLDDPAYFPEEDLSVDGSLQLTCGNVVFKPPLDAQFIDGDVIRSSDAAADELAVLLSALPASPARVESTNTANARAKTGRWLLKLIATTNLDYDSVLNLLDSCELQFFTIAQQLANAEHGASYRKAKVLRGEGSRVLVNGLKTPLLLMANDSQGPKANEVVEDEDNSGTAHASPNRRRDEAAGHNHRLTGDPWEAKDPSNMAPGVWMSDGDQRHAVAAAQSLLNSVPSQQQKDMGDVPHHDEAIDCIPLPKHANLHGGYALIETQLKTAMGDPMQIVMGLLEGPLGAVLNPVSDLVGAIVGAAVSGLIEQNMGGTTTPGIAQRVNDGLKAALLGSLTTSLIRPLTATAAAAVSDSASQSLRSYVSLRVNGTVGHPLLESLNETLTKMLPSIVSRGVPQEVARRVMVPLQHSLSRSLTQAIVPALMHVLTHSPLQDYYCYYCAKHKAYCAYCHAAPQQLYYASQYSSYYATYFATFYAKYFSSRVVSETQ